MSISIHNSFVAHLDVRYEGMHWITMGPPDQPDTSIVVKIQELR